MAAYALFVCEECAGAHCRGVRAGEQPFFVRVDGRSMCVWCWRAAGRPWPKTPAPVSHEREAATRQAMLKRGGEDAYKVRSGGT